MQNSTKTIDQELFYYDKLKEIKSKQTRSSNFGEQKNNLSKYNYGAKLASQETPRQFDGAEATVADDAEEIPEEFPETIARGDEDKNYAAFNQAKKEALDKAFKREKGISNIERLQKTAQAVKQLKNVKNLKQLYNLVKITTGCTLWGIIITYIIMIIQFVGGNIFKSKYIPPLGMIEKLIFIPVFVISTISTLPIFILPLVTTGAVAVIVGTIVEKGSQVLQSVGIL